MIDIANDDYDPLQDFWQGWHEALAVVRERMRNGGPTWEPKMSEQEILARYSTPGLKKVELDRYAKKWQLMDFKMSAEERDKILSDLYPQPEEPTT